MTSKHRVFPIVLALLLMAVSFMSPLKASATEYVDDLELVDYIDEIVVEGDQALVSYSIPIVPFGVWRGWTPDGSVELIGSGEIVNMSQDITTNTYQSFISSVVVGTFTPVASNSYYKHQVEYSYSDDLKNITHMMYDGVLYDVSITAEGDTYILINDAGDNYSFRGCYFYKDNNPSLPNTLQAWFNDNEEHTIIFGTMVDVTEVVREYDAIFGNLYPLGVEGSHYRVIDVSDLKSGASFDFSYTYDFLWQVLGTAGPLSSGFTAYFLDEDFALLSESCSNAYFTPELSDNRIHGTHAGTITVPEGAAYLYFDFSFPRVNVADCLIFQFLIKNLKITCATSALEANSKSIEVVQNRIADMSEDISNLQDQMQGVQDSVDDLNQGIQDTNEKLDDIFSGGEAGDELGDASDQLDQNNSDLGGTLDDMDNAKEDLPEMSQDDIDSIIGNLDSFNQSNIGDLMPWNDPEYEDFWVVMLTPTIGSVSVALLLYFVFGKARSM